MRMLPVVGLALSVVFLLSGCLPPQHSATPTPLRTSTPAFASDEEALAAATVAYGEYLRVSDAITADGGTSPERIKPLVTDEQYSKIADSASRLTKQGWRTVGATRFNKMSVAQLDQSDRRSLSVDLYVCVDVSVVRILDGAGSDVTPATRQDVVPIEISFLSSSANESELILSRSESWTGTDFC